MKLSVRIFLLLLTFCLILPMSACASAGNGRNETTAPDEGQTSPEGADDGIIPLDEVLVSSVTKYLRRVNSELTPKVVSIQNLMDWSVQREGQALHVRFDASEFYYACAYYSCTQHTEEQERDLIPCNYHYTWVGYDDAAKIPQIYEGAPLIVAFQLNKALFCRDIAPGARPVPTMEHFQIFEPEFRNGFNIAEPLLFDETFIYLNNRDSGTVYHSTDDRSGYKIPCIELSGHYYLTQYLFTVGPDGMSPENESSYLEKFRSEDAFGRYYDDLIAVMDTDSYSVHVKQGNTGSTLFYGLIRVEDFSEVLVDYQEREPAIRFLQIDYGFSSVIQEKTVSTCDSVFRIIEALESSAETGETVEAYSTEPWRQELAMQLFRPGTLWFEIGSSIYRMNSDLTQLCRVEGHFGKGYVLEMSEALRSMIYKVRYYAPLDYYLGTYSISTDTLEIENVYEAESLVSIKVLDLTLADHADEISYITLEITSAVDQEPYIQLICRQSDDNIGAGDARYVTLEEGKPQTVVLGFSGFEEWYYVRLGIDNTFLHIRIKP